MNSSLQLFADRESKALLLIGRRRSLSQTFNETGHGSILKTRDAIATGQLSIFRGGLEGRGVISLVLLLPEECQEAGRRLPARCDVLHCKG